MSLSINDKDIVVDLEDHWLFSMDLREKYRYSDEPFPNM